MSAWKRAAISNGRRLRAKRAAGGHLERARSLDLPYRCDAREACREVARPLAERARDSLFTSSAQRLRKRANRMSEVRYGLGHR